MLTPTSVLESAVNRLRSSATLAVCFYMKKRILHTNTINRRVDIEVKHSTSWPV